MAKDQTQRVRELLAARGGQRLCAVCVARVTSVSTAGQAARAMAVLAADAGYRVEDADCNVCGNYRLTVRALWPGL